MKRNLYLIMLALVGLLCGSGQFFKVGAQIRSAKKNAFTPNHSIRACTGSRTPWRAARRARGQPGSPRW
jgi:hypothetical protein